MQVWVLHIAHKHGDDYWVFTSEQSAKDRVITWAKEWWENEVGEDAMPDDPDELLHEYFDQVSGKESYRIEEATLLGDDP